MLPSSVKSAMSFSSYGEQNLSHESLSDRKRKSYAHCDELSQDVTEISTASNFSDSNHMCKRRKLQKSTVVVFSVDSDIDGVSIPSTLESPPIKAFVKAAEKHDKDLGDYRVDPVIRSKSESHVKECANPDIMNLNVCDKDRSLKKLCISVLRSNGLLKVPPVRSSATIETLEIDSASTDFCQICGRSENILKMLICDHCECAFHKSCCNPRIKKDVLSIDEWFCATCSKLEHKSLPEIYFGKSLRFGVSTVSAKRELGPIEYMLRYPELHVSRVRIGETFQAEVPEWSGQRSNSADCIGEPLELEPVDTIAPTQCRDEIPKRKSITNWLQCREPLYDYSGKPIERTICGKWRRAPLYESQTDDWECFCSVLWDPRHSDCAVPQEVATDEVLSQLKYIEQLKSHLNG